MLHVADLFRQRMKMLHAVSVSAKAIASMHATERACLLHHHYLEAFRLQQQEQQGKGRPRCFPEHDIRFAFEEGGMIFGVNRPGVDRSGIPLWTGAHSVSGAVINASHHLGGLKSLVEQ